MFSWSFSSRKEHSASWYITAIIVVLMLVGYGIYDWLYLMSIVAFLFAGVYVLMENNSAPMTSVEIDEQSIRVGGSVYELKDIEKFAVISIANIPAFLRIFPRKKLSPVIDIPLSHDVNPVELKNFLAGYIEEDKNATLSNSDAIIHAMRL
jgi:hypothetical protein